MSNNKNTEEGAVIINTLRKIFNIFLNIVIFAEICLVIVFFVPNLIGMKTYVVTSGSMEPLYPVGSLIYIKTVQPNEVKVNDAITFYMENTEIVATHQVYEIDEEKRQFRTQGVNNKDENGNIISDARPVNFSNLIGKPVLCVENLGYLNRFITTSPGIYFVISFTVFIILIYYILEKKKNTGVE